ncbi:SigE family RNA polymerase sigma factor [Geodermatophilus sp. FMUSA9-8]|uniref:SigE family RNA polymerase sigma factor n=1 Tax=Geodermatophilus sp. FMUSA9-8 TaxID=3120155 RepID=UPI00300A8700
MARLSEGEAAAFDAFVKQRRESLLRTAFLLTGDLGRAEDLVQAALLETFRRWPRLHQRTDPIGYTRKTLVSRHIDSVRRRSWREVPIDLSAGPGAVEKVGVADHDGVPDRLLLRAALLGLPPRMRAVLVLRYFDDLTEADTAGLLGCSVGTVKSTAFRGLARLREALADTGPPSPHPGPGSNPGSPAVRSLSAFRHTVEEDHR